MMNTCITYLSLAAYTLAAVVALCVFTAVVGWAVQRLATPVLRSFINWNFRKGCAE